MWMKIFWPREALRDTPIWAKPLSLALWETPSLKNKVILCVNIIRISYILINSIHLCSKCSPLPNEKKALKCCCTFRRPLAVMSFHDGDDIMPWRHMTSWHHTKGSPCVPWRTTQVSGAQQTLVPLVHHDAQRRSVVHNIVLCPPSGAQRKGSHKHTPGHMGPFLCPPGFVEPTLCTTSTVQNYVVHHQPALCTMWHVVHWSALELPSPLRSYLCKHTFQLHSYLCRRFELPSHRPKFQTLISTDWGTIWSHLLIIGRPEYLI